MTGRRADGSPSPHPAPASGRRVTMSDIAREAGCSQSTVSFVLNDNRSISIGEDTRRRVIATARRLGYNAPQLRTLGGSASARTTRGARGRPRRIAFVIDALSTSPEGIVAIEGIRQALAPSGTLLVIAETGNDPEIEPRTLGAFADDGVAGIVYACVFTRRVEVPPALVRTGLPAVLLNCHSADLSLPSVVPSEIAGGARATRALIDAGHERIGTILGERIMDAALDRLEGYRRALASADIPFDADLVVEGDWSASAGYRGAEALVSLPRPPSAIFCQNDRMAIGCYELLKERGLRIPGDVSVVGYDDEEIARHLSPPLTTLVLPHREMGRWAVERLQEGPGPAGEPVSPVKLECRLIERDSVGPPAGPGRGPARR